MIGCSKNRNVKICNLSKQKCMLVKSITDFYIINNTMLKFPVYVLYLWRRRRVGSNKHYSLVCKQLKEKSCDKCTIRSESVEVFRFVLTLCSCVSKFLKSPKKDSCVFQSCSFRHCCSFGKRFLCDPPLPLPRDLCFIMVMRGCA